MTSRAGLAPRVGGFLGGAMVLAQIESDPEAPDSVLVTVAINADARVAVVNHDGERITAGPLLSELAQAIADDVHGEADFSGPAAVKAESAGHDDGPDPFEHYLDVDAAYAPDRAVVFARTGAAGVIDLATAVDDQVHTRVHHDGQIIYLADCPSLTSLELPEELIPAVVVEQGAAFPSVAVFSDSGHVHVHTWDTDVTDVPEVAKLPAASDHVKAFVDTTIGTGALVREIMRVFPAAEPTAIRTAITGTDPGPAVLLAGLGLPADAAAFLDHSLPADELEQTVLVGPDTMVESLRRVMSGAMSEASVTMTETAEAMRQRAEAMRLRAETAFDAAETFTEEVVLPARQSWVTPSLAVAESVLGALALRRARKGGATGVVLGVAGAVLLTDAVVNLVIAAAPVLRRRG